MLKRLTATVLAASVALTSVFAAPARAADSGEIARAILGAGVILYLGNELAKRNNRGYVTRRYDDRYYGNRYYDHDRDYRGHRDHRYKHRKTVPVSCLRNNGYDRYFGAHCLSQRMRNASRLPEQCRISVRTSRGWRSAYEADCLRRYGYRFV